MLTVQTVWTEFDSRIHMVIGENNSTQLFSDLYTHSSYFTSTAKSRETWMHVHLLAHLLARLLTCLLACLLVLSLLACSCLLALLLACLCSARLLARLHACLLARLLACFLTHLLVLTSLVLSLISLLFKTSCLGNASTHSVLDFSMSINEFMTYYRPNPHWDSFPSWV